MYSLEVTLHQDHVRGACLGSPKCAYCPAPAKCPELHWDCPICHAANIDYYPLPSLEVLCDSCGAWLNADEMEEKGLKAYE